MRGIKDVQTQCLETMMERRERMEWRKMERVLEKATVEEVFSFVKPKMETETKMMKDSRECWKKDVRSSSERMSMIVREKNEIKWRMKAKRQHEKKKHEKKRRWWKVEKKKKRRKKEKSKKKLEVRIDV